MLRHFLTPRWLVKHAVAVILTATCLGLGWWQVQRAEGGNVLSYGYMFEWPVFAAFVVFFWWKLIRFERQPPTDQARPQPAPPPPPPPPRPADDQDDPELAAYNRYLAGLYEQDRSTE